jgi:transcriptional regulator with XRE-family HTH domain
MTNATGATRLRALREQHGWTQQETAEQLAKLAFLRIKKQVGVNADMIAKWERGVKVPSRQYRELLALLFGVPASELVAVEATPPSASVSAEESTCWPPSAMRPPCSITSGTPGRSCNQGCSTPGGTRSCADARYSS